MAKSSARTSQSKVKVDLDDALSGGNISASVHDIMVENLDTLQITDPANVDPDSMTEDRLTLVVPVIDATGSLLGQDDTMREEFNKMLEAFKLSRMSDAILVSTCLFNTSAALLHGFVKLADADRLTKSNYRPQGGTALYDAVMHVLTVTAAYVAQLVDRGYRVKIVVPIFTDGEDNSSRVDTADLRRVVTELLGQGNYVIGITAFGQGFAFDAAQTMGLPRENVYETGKDEKSVRSAWQMNSSSVIRQSQTQIGSSSFFNP